MPTAATRSPDRRKSTTRAVVSAGVVVGKTALRPHIVRTGARRAHEVSAAGLDAAVEFGHGSSLMGEGWGGCDGAGVALATPPIP